MENTNFAEYILNEKSLSEKMNIMYFLHKKQNVFFDNTVVFKTEVCRMFLSHMKIDVDVNLVLTACLLYSVKKSTISFDLNKIKTYAREGAEYLKTLGFDDRFCKICLEANRYNDSKKREKESDILELVDNFGMLLDRDDRMGFSPEEAIFILENKNLKNVENIYLEDFKEFVMEMENVASLGLDKSRLITNWQKKINGLPKYKIEEGMKLAKENRKEAMMLYVEGKKIEIDKDGIRTNKRQIDYERKMQQELAEQIDKKGKFSDLLDENA